MPPLSYNRLFERLALILMKYIMTLAGNDSSHDQSTMKTYEITKIDNKYEIYAEMQ